MIEMRGNPENCVPDDRDTQLEMPELTDWSSTNGTSASNGLDLGGNNDRNFRSHHRV